MKKLMICVIAVVLVFVPFAACTESGDTFDSLLSKYKKIEENNHALSDNLNEEEFGWATRDGSNFLFEVVDIKLVYCYLDINNDGVDELILGGQEVNDSGEVIHIAVIYALAGGKAVPVLQTSGYPTGIWILEDENNNPVIERAQKRMNFALEEYYTIGDKGELVTLDILHTGSEFKYDEERGVSYYGRTKEVNGAEVPISEREYENLLRKYGSNGYIPLGGELAFKEVKLSWKLVTEWEKK